MSLALVTGGNRGIGLEVARQLGRDGIQILLGSRDGFFRDGHPVPW